MWTTCSLSLRVLHSSYFSPSNSLLTLCPTWHRLGANICWIRRGRGKKEGRKEGREVRKGKEGGKKRGREGRKEERGKRMKDQKHGSCFHLIWMSFNLSLSCKTCHFRKVNGFQWASLSNNNRMPWPLHRSTQQQAQAQRTLSESPTLSSKTKLHPHHFSKTISQTWHNR